jgi:predicted MFS family arabinose efflux permease
MAKLMALPYTIGIMALGAVTYAAFMSLRGLWLGPLLVDRHGFTLVQAGNVALVLSVLGMLGPPLFGRMDPGDRTRRRWIVAYTVLVAVLYGVIAASRSAWLDVTVSIAMSLVSGFIVLQYSDVRSAYPAAMTGRAMALFTMAMFLGVGLVQWVTGLVASLAPGWGFETYTTVMASIGALLALAAVAFILLPAPSMKAAAP